MRIGFGCWAMALLLSAPLLGCDDDPAAEEGETATSGDPLAPGFAKAGESGLKVELMALSPAETVRGDNTWTVKVTDGNGPQAACAMSVEPFMPAHGHGAGRVVEVKDRGEGTYELTPLNLFMRGLWTVDLSLDCDGLTDVVRFEVWVEG